MPFDNLCKLLSEKYPDRFASWVLGKPQQSVEVLKTELSIEPIRADSVTFLQLQGRLLHLEFQTKLESNPPLPLRMIDYWVRLYRLYRLPITQIIVLLLPPSEDTVIETAFIVENTRHEHQVLRLWEQEPELFLNDPALLPLATLAATTDSEALLRETAQRVSQLEVERKQEVSTYTQILAGLKFEKALIQKIFREGMMRESVIYQDILEEGREEGRSQGELNLIIRLLTRRFGAVDETVRSRIVTLPLALLEDLGEALLDFAEIEDLINWLQTHAPESNQPTAP